MADDLFDQVKQELEENQQQDAEGEAEKTAAEMVDEISWDDVAADLDQQREMIKDEAQSGKSGKAAAESGDNVDGLLPSLEPEQRRHLPENINFILDIPLQLSVELGRTRMIIMICCSWGRGRWLSWKSWPESPLTFW